MRRFIAALISVWSLASVAVAREPWVTQTGLTSAQLSSRVLTFAKPGYGLQIEEVSGYEENGVTRYAARWGPAADTVARISYAGMTASTFISIHNSIQAAGWRLFYINGFNSGGTDYFNAVYRKTSGVTQVLRVGDSLAAHQSADASLTGSGHYMETLCSYQSGSSIKYAAVWNQSAVIPVSDVSYSLTGDELATEVSTRSSSWRIHALCGHTLSIVIGGGSPLRYTVLWRKPKLSTNWGILVGMNKDNYFAADSNQTGIGWRPSFLQFWKNGSDVAVNGMWVPNGGLPSTYVNQIDTLVTDAMAAQSIPALSLAISRNGRLMFKRAYGLADQEVGEWAGTDHRFRIASVSKAVTGVSVLHALENQSTWNLNSKAFGTAAVFGNDYGTPPYSTRVKAISISNLLHHTAGWSGEGKLWWDTEPSWGSSHQEFIDWQVDNEPFVADPGIVGHYSNLGFTIAARVVEKLTGNSYETYTRNEIFAPCGISTILGPVVGERTRAQRKFMEVAYYPNPSDSGDPYVIDPRRMDGSTAWIARPSDLLLFSRRVDGDSEFADIISANTVTQLHTRETPNSSVIYDWRTYGCGWYTDDYSNPGYWGHNGGMYGTRAELISGTDGISYAWATNIRREISNDALESILNDITAANAWPDIDLFGVHHPAYTAWQVANFPSLELGQRGLDEVLSDPSADPDGDDIPNAAEYYLGLDPNSPDGSPFKVTQVGGSMRIRWLVKSGIEGATMTFRSSTDLKTWLGLIGVSITSPGGVGPVGYSWRQLDVPMTGAKRFIRFEYKVR